MSPHGTTAHAGSISSLVPQNSHLVLGDSGTCLISRKAKTASQGAQLATIIITTKHATCVAFTEHPGMEAVLLPIATHTV